MRLQDDKRLTPHELFVKASKSAIYTYFNALAQKYTLHTAIAKAVKEFDEVWIDHQDNLIYDGRLKNYSGRLLMERIATIYTPRRDEVVAVNFPIELSLTSKLIVTDSVDILIINKEKRRQTIRGISLMDTDSNNNERYLDLRANIFKMTIQRYLGNQIRRHYKYEVRSFTSPDKIIEPKLYQRYPIIRLVTNIMKGIKHGVWYPTTSKETCKQCHLKRICKMDLLCK